MYNRNGKLSPREIQVLQLVAEECTYNQIGLRLCVSPQTVKNHMSKLLSKLGVETRVGAVLVGIRRGYVVVPGIALASNRRRMRRLEQALELIVSYEFIPIVSRRDLIELARKALETEDERREMEEA